MAKLRLTAEARADLADIDDYGVVHFGPDVADAYSRGFAEAFMLLRRHPLAGAETGLGRTVRSLAHRRHRIYYRMTGETVLILRVMHHAMDARRALKR